MKDDMEINFWPSFCDLSMTLFLGIIVLFALSSYNNGELKGKVKKSGSTIPRVDVFMYRTDSIVRSNGREVSPAELREEIVILAKEKKPSGIEIIFNSEEDNLTGVLKKYLDATSMPGVSWRLENLRKNYQRSEK